MNTGSVTFRVSSKLREAVEKHAETHPGDFPHAVGPARGEHLEANLGPPDPAAEAGQDWRDFARGRGVEDEN